MKKQDGRKEKNVSLTYEKTDKGYINLYLIVDDMFIPIKLSFYNRKLLYKLSKIVDGANYVNS